jgi:tetratricopeptide (TPR) repeat protein
LPLCRDQLAVAESLGVLLEEAYDELHAQGPQNFKKGKPIAITNEATFSIEDALQRAEDGLAAGDFGAALKCAQQVLRVSPAHATARAMVGRANMGLGQFGRAVEYLLAAVQTSDNPVIWFDLAVALYQNDQRQQAVQALETTLRLDGTRTDAWAMLVELAREVGANDIAAEALTAFAQLAPSDPRVALLQSQAGAA